MALFGRKKKKATTAKPKTTKKTAKGLTKKKTTAKKKTTKAGSRANEAQAVLAKMQAKKDAGDCAFC